MVDFSAHMTLDFHKLFNTSVENSQMGIAHQALVACGIDLESAVGMSCSTFMK